MNDPLSFTLPTQEARASHNVTLKPEHIEGLVYSFLGKHYDRFAAVPECHREWWEMYCSPAEQVAIAAPRDHAKSTSLTLAFGLSELLFRITDYALIVSDTYDQACEHLAEYRRELGENDELKKFFGIVKFVRDSNDDLIVRFKDGVLFRVRALGMEGPVRGLRWRGGRPGLILVDDAENTELVESKTRRRKSMNWLMKDLFPAGRRGRKVRMHGTILHQDAALARFCRSKKWKSKIYRAHKDFRDFSEILWPERWPEEALRAKRDEFIEEGASEGYSQEYLNDPVVEGESFFRPADLLPFPPDWKIKPRILRYYASWDFAFSTEAHADWTVCVIIGVDENNYIYVIDVRRFREDTASILGKIFAVENDFHPECQVFEKGAYEKAIRPFLDEQMRLKGIWPVIETVAPSKDKQVRAKSWQQKVKAHHVHYDHDAHWWPGLQEEMVRFPRAQHDDQVDPQSQLGLILDKLLAAPTLKEASDEEYEDQPGFYNRTQHGRSKTTGY